MKLHPMQLYQVSMILEKVIEKFKDEEIVLELEKIQSDIIIENLKYYKEITNEILQEARNEL